MTQVETRSEANLALVQKFFESYATGDLQTLERKVLAPDATWYVPGYHPLAGAHRGVREITAYYRNFAAVDLHTERLYLHADDSRVVEIFQGWTDRGCSGDIDMIWVAVYEIARSRIANARIFASDQPAADALLRDLYRLAPLPERLLTA